MSWKVKILVVLGGLWALAVCTMAACYWTFQNYGALPAVGAFLVVTLGGGYALKVGVSRVLHKLVRAPFKAKGAVLKGAKARVHVIRKAKPPKPEEGEDLPKGHLEWYTIEATITPAPSEGPFHGWSPDELMLVPPDYDPEHAANYDDASIVRTRTWEDNAWSEVDGVNGEARVRFVVALAKGAPRVLRFGYYFEKFGKLDFSKALALRGTAPLEAPGDD